MLVCLRCTHSFQGLGSLSSFRPTFLRCQFVVFSPPPTSLSLVFCQLQQKPVPFVTCAQRRCEFSKSNNTKNSLPHIDLRDVISGSYLSGHVTYIAVIMYVNGRVLLKVYYDEVSILCVTRPT